MSASPSGVFVTTDRVKGGEARMKLAEIGGVIPVVQTGKSG
jgi:hypothetical protein